MQENAHLMQNYYIFLCLHINKIKIYKTKFSNSSVTLRAKQKRSSTGTKEDKRK